MFHISIGIKEGRYRIVINSYTHEYTAPNGMVQSFGDISESIKPDHDISIAFCGSSCQSKYWTELQMQCRQNNERLAASIKKAMASSAKSDW